MGTLRTGLYVAAIVVLLGSLGLLITGRSWPVFVIAAVNISIMVDGFHRRRQRSPGQE